MSISIFLCSRQPDGDFRGDVFPSVARHHKLLPGEPGGGGLLRRYILRLSDAHQLLDEQLAAGRLSLQSVHVRARALVHRQHTDPRGGMHRALSGHRPSYQMSVYADQKTPQDGDRCGMDPGGRVRLAQIFLRRDYQQSSQQRRRRHHLHSQYQKAQQERSGRGESRLALPPAALPHVLPLYQDCHRSLEERCDPRRTRPDRQDQKRESTPRALVQ